MGTYRLALYFRENKGSPLGRPISHVYVRTPIKHNYPDAKDLIFLTPREFGPETVEHQIDALIEELQTIKRQVREKYDAYTRRLTEESR